LDLQERPLAAGAPVQTNGTAPVAPASLPARATHGAGPLTVTPPLSLPQHRPRRHALPLAGSLQVAVQSLWQNRTRSFLAMLGIIVGVASVITMMALGEGTRRQVEDRIRAMGTNILTVRAGEARQVAVRLGNDTSQGLTLDDASAILSHCPAVRRVSPRQASDLQVKYRNRNTRVEIAALTSDYFAIRSYPVARGRAFTATDIRHRRRVCLVGPELVRRLFERHDPMGQWIRVGGQAFRIIGLMSPRGGSDTDWDERVYIPITTGMARLFAVKYLRQIETEAISQGKMDEAEAQMEALLRKRHRLRADQKNDFLVRNQLDLLQTADETGRTLTMLLAGIAAISLIVGGIGIMNIMMVSVIERTREIGIRRAIGARRCDILAQFLIEAIVLCGAGAALGVGMGGVSSWAGATYADWPMRAHPAAIPVSCGVAVATGLLFGLYPAVRAAHLSPLEALRHE
jgi:ABC-type antimicrobial peptide transport system permease subunit